MVSGQPPKVGKNIMNQRKSRGMSLDELAKRSGVSKSMLSQIEQEKTNPTVITVWKIARSLDLSVQEIMETGNDSLIEVTRCDDSPLIYSEDKLCIIRVNSPIHMTDNLELYHMTFKPGGVNQSLPHYPNAVEFLTVITGQLEVTSGRHSKVLNKGDSARYRGDREHSIKNLSDTISEAYLVVWFPK
jgi:transcriptional regulator with XRE-family HTH domain